MRSDRHWFLTWHTYGTWLPGDSRGFVSPLRDEVGEAHIRNIPQTRLDSESPHLEAWSRERLKCDPITLTDSQASILAEQFFETVRFRGWNLLAFAIVTNHIHLVLGVTGDPDPIKLLRDFKTYGSRALNLGFPCPASGTWWTESGSKRKLSDELSILGDVRYTVEQAGALVIWTAPIPELNLGGGYLKRAGERGT
jgi:REP element-mobilizing transposase RayT